MDDKYVDDAVDSWQQKAVQTGISSMPITVSASLPAAKSVTSSAGKLFPLLGGAFLASDGIEGYNNANAVFSNPGLAEKIASGIANISNTTTLGLVPKSKSALGLASLLTGRRHTLPDVSDEVLSRYKNLELLKK